MPILLFLFTTASRFSASIRAFGKSIRFMPLPLFGKTHKSPTEIMRSLRDALLVIENNDKKNDKKVEKAVDDVNRWLQAMKVVIYGQEGQEPNTEQVANLAQETYSLNILPMLIKNLTKLDFESKKDVALIFNNLLRRQIGTRSPTVEYLCARPNEILTLLNGYDVSDIAITCGQMLRECIRHEHLARIVLCSEDFYNFFRFVEVSTFDIASDAFSTFKDVITKHKAMCAEFLDTNYDRFFEQYGKLLLSENYVTRRQSLKLLGELLLDRHNFNVMTKYISNPDNLKLMMNLLREKSKSIQFEAFHVFKVSSEPRA
ncbi:hypothetical protein L596_014594 [Steinernema carpocapsae]|uniref:Mo25-like protein n=1 Tax=Steinernema carpocapsae TaxID=34508 RepID=A0A4U5ND54_STECR|nr:hypothetical protein L596_014594 [Steinernema carpocapsae]